MNWSNLHEHIQREGRREGLHRIRLWRIERPTRRWRRCRGWRRRTWWRWSTGIQPGTGRVGPVSAYPSHSSSVAAAVAAAAASSPPDLRRRFSPFLPTPNSNSLSDLSSDEALPSFRLHTWWDYPARHCVSSVLRLEGRRQTGCFAFSFTCHSMESVRLPPRGSFRGVPVFFFVFNPINKILLQQTPELISMS